MLRYDQLRRNHRKFLALTGLTPKEFETLLLAFTRAYEQKYPPHQTLAGQRRQRQIGAGRKGALDCMGQKLLFVLVYQKTYSVQELLGEVFDLSQARANYWVHRLLPVLRDALADLDVLPERDPHQFARHEQRQQEALDFIVDGTERRRQRPKDPEQQALHYSGKKKTHSDKNLVIAHTQTKRVGYLSQTYVGKIHDKKIADLEAIVYPRGTTLRKDTGFQGYEPGGCQTYQPKKSRGKGS